MTFIASVIAKKGAAIIADSLVTTTVPSIQMKEFLDFLREKAKEALDDEIKIEPEEIIELFKSRTSHTKDYEEKLFEFDRFTAITTAGAAMINGKRIAAIIDEIKEINRRNKAYNRKRITTKIRDFRSYLEEQIKTHLEKNGTIGITKFIVTHYNEKKGTSIYKLKVNAASIEDLSKPEFELITERQANDWEKVVCEGQNRISQNILFGTLNEIHGVIPRVLSKVISDFKIPLSGAKLADYMEKMRNDEEVISKGLIDEMKIFKLSELSLQQAVDLANLLMRIEIDFQTYTENIPTVGGVIKLAIIDREGFKFVSGHEIMKPN